MRKSVVVVGGGVAGLVSALIARRKGADVTVVEQASRAGGLWWSQSVSLAGETHDLDHGLRLPLTSGLSEWDADLFHNPHVDFDWVQFDGFPREAALFDDMLTQESSCFDARLLGRQTNAAGLLGLVAAVAKRPDPDAAAYANDFEFITAHYGSVYRDHIFAPIMRGFFKRELHELAPGVNRSIVPRRIIATDVAERERFVAELPELAGVLAHAEHAALPRDMPRRFIYPRSGHISCWVTALQQHLQDLGVNFIFGTGVKGIAQETGAAQLTLGNGSRLQGDVVVWSLPLVFLALMRPDLGLKPLLPDFITLGVHHLKLDRPLPHDRQYLLNFNANPALFRAVFRDNILGTTSNIVTVEQLLHLRRDEMPESEDQAARRCLDELQRCGAVGQDANLVAHACILHRNFLPVLTPQYAAFNTELAQRVAETLPAVEVVGRAGNGALFLDGIIHDALGKLTERLDTQTARRAHAG